MMQSSRLAAARNVQLDMLRGVAVLSVLFSHIYKVPASVAGEWWAACLAQMRSMGWVGVDLFFVLSGFLVSGLIFSELKKHQSFQGGRFLIRRGFKIYPAYYISILVGLLQVATMPHNQVTNQYIASLLVFLQNYFPTNTLTEPMWSHMWSLAVEEHFYIALTLVFIILLQLKKDLRVVPKLCIFVFGFSCLMRALLCCNHKFDGQIFYSPYVYTHCRIDALAFGVMLAYFYHNEGEQLKELVTSRKTLWFVLGLALISPCLVFQLNNFFTLVFGLTLLYLGFGILLLVSIYSQEMPILSRALAKVGFYSYSIYVWHRLVWFWVFMGTLFYPVPYGVQLIIYFASSIGFGIIAGRAIEIPFLTLRDKLVPSRTASTHEDIAPASVATTQSQA